jgi:hypothetical protein
MRNRASLVRWISGSRVAPCVALAVSNQDVRDAAETLRDIGVPGIVGTLLGTLLGAWLAGRNAARGRDEQRQDSFDMLIRQRELDAIQGLDEKLDRLQRGLNDPRRDREQVLSELVNDSGLSVRYVPIRDVEIRRRLGVLATFALLVWQTPSSVLGFFPAYAATEAIDDVRRALKASLTGGVLPGARFPPLEELLELWRAGKDGDKLEQLNLRLRDSSLHQGDRGVEELASPSPSSSRCTYVRSVNPGSLWPSHSCTCLTFFPASNSSDCGRVPERVERRPTARPRPCGRVERRSRRMTLAEVLAGHARGRAARRATARTARSCVAQPG